MVQRVRGLCRNVIDGTADTMLNLTAAGRPGKPIDFALSVPVPGREDVDHDQA
jgi:hypothetical protein